MRGFYQRDEWHRHIWQANHRLTWCFTVCLVGPFTSSVAQEDMRCSVGLGSDLMFSDLFPLDTGISLLPIMSPTEKQSNDPCHNHLLWGVTVPVSAIYILWNCKVKENFLLLLLCFFRKTGFGTHSVDHAGLELLKKKTSVLPDFWANCFMHYNVQGNRLVNSIFGYTQDFAENSFCLAFEVESIP